MVRILALAAFLTLATAAAVGNAQEPGIHPPERQAPRHGGYFGGIYLTQPGVGDLYPQLCYSGPRSAFYHRERRFHSNLSARSDTVYASTRANPDARSLLKDLDGRCFERKVDQIGNELLEELPASACTWTRIAGTR